MGHYKSNVRDLEFNLFECSIRQGFGQRRIRRSRRGVRAEMLAEAARKRGTGRQASKTVDRHPPRIDPRHTGDVAGPVQRVRAGLAARRLVAGRTRRRHRRCARARDAAVGDQRISARRHPPAFFYLSGPLMLEVLFSVGDEQQRHWAALASNGTGAQRWS